MTRTLSNTFVAIIALSLSSGILAGAESSGTQTTDIPLKNATLVYVGTYTGKPAGSKGIYLFRLPAEGGETPQNVALMPLGIAAETESPSFLTLDAKRRLLFCANETESFGGKPGGGVSAFSIDPATGKLKLINQRSSMGNGPCHVVLDKTGRNILVANYNSGNVAVFPVSSDGHLGEATCVIQDTGKGPNHTRQEGPHAHCVTLSPDNRFAFVCDLGTDKVMIFKFDAEHGQLIPNDPPFVSVKPGAGPRHMVFHPNGKFAYVINEIDSTLSAFAYDKNTGSLKELQTVSSLPENYHGRNTAAEIAVAPTGKFLFASNRGENTVVSFAIDSNTGTLSRVAGQSTGGKTPRHFGIQPSGERMVICNQDSNTALVCGIDPGNGRLTSSGIFTDIPSPTCAVFLPPTGGDK